EVDIDDGFLFSSRRRHTRSKRDWSSDVCSSDLCHHRKKKTRILCSHHFAIHRNWHRHVDVFHRRLDDSQYMDWAIGLLNYGNRFYSNGGSYLFTIKLCSKSI